MNELSTNLHRDPDSHFLPKKLKYFHRFAYLFISCSFQNFSPDFLFSLFDCCTDFSIGMKNTDPF